MLLIAKRRDGRRGEDGDEETSAVPTSLGGSRVTCRLYDNMYDMILPETRVLRQEGNCVGAHQAREPCARSFAINVFLRHAAATTKEFIGKPCPIAMSSGRRVCGLNTFFPLGALGAEYHPTILRSSLSCCRQSKTLKTDIKIHIAICDGQQEAA